MGRQGLLDARRLAQPFHHDEYHGAREVMPPSVKKHVVVLSGLDAHLPPIVEPKLQFAHRPLGDGHQPLLAALAHDAHKPRPQAGLLARLLGIRADVWADGATPAVR